MSPVDFEIWLNHFEHHAEHERCVADGHSDVLRPAEQQLIANSIATFQLGEQSEGHTLLLSHLLLALRSGRTTPVRALMSLCHRAFFVSTACVVWFTHRPVLRQGGFELRSFLRASRAQYGFYMEPVNGALEGASVA